MEHLPPAATSNELMIVDGDAAGRLAARVCLEPISEFLGAEVRGITACELAALGEAPEAAAVFGALAKGLQERLVLRLRCREGATASPAALRALYQGLHRALGLGCSLPTPKVPDPSGQGPEAARNLRGACPPGFPETTVLGHMPCECGGLQDWHGLTGELRPSAWWEETSCQFHHDGGYSVRSPPPPALVAMSCAIAPRAGELELRWPDGATQRCGPGATLFFSTRLPLVLAPSSVRERARRMTCYYQDGFGAVKRDSYPLMKPSGLTPAAPPPEAVVHGHRSITEFTSLEALAFGDAAGDLQPGLFQDGFFRHALVQTNCTSGCDYIMVHALCLKHLHEEGRGPLSWQESMDFIEELLGPAAKPPYLLALDWQEGDVVFWDNRSTQHSATPTHRLGDNIAYVALGEKRLMTRTAMQPTWLPTVGP